MEMQGLGLGLNLKAPQRKINKHAAMSCPKMQHCDGIKCNVVTGKTARVKAAKKRRLTGQERLSED